MAGERTHHTEDHYRVMTRRLWLGIILGLMLVVAEALIGVFTQSLALMSDAAHNAADILAVGLALFAVYVMAREPTERRTYGYGRVGILTALANSVGLVVIAGVLAFEAIRRMQHIEAVSGYAVFTVALVALFINTIIAMTLFSHRHDLNIRSAFLHMVMDAAVSLGVLLAGVIIIFTDWYYADPLVALLISAFILYAAWGIIKEATDILLESVPRHINLSKVQEAMESMPGVEAVHHLHVWELGSGVYALSGHVEVTDRQLSECSPLMQDLNRLLAEEFNIIHPTIQIESTAACPTGDTNQREGSSR
jgi:cobalt-zinc-cadmium efflux system protein